MSCRNLVAIIGLVALIACSDAGDAAGVVVDIDAFPDWSCIRNVIQRNGEITVLADSAESTGRRLTLHGLAPPGSVQRFVYRSEGIAYALQIYSDSGMPIQYRHYSLFQRDKATAEELDRSLQVVGNVAAAVEAECHLAGLSQRVQKFCRSKACPKSLSGRLTF